MSINLYRSHYSNDFLEIRVENLFNDLYSKILKFSRQFMSLDDFSIFFSLALSQQTKYHCINRHKCDNLSTKIFLNNIRLKKLTIILNLYTIRSFFFHWSILYQTDRKHLICCWSFLKFFFIFSFRQYVRIFATDYILLSRRSRLKKSTLRYPGRWFRHPDPAGKHRKLSEFFPDNFLCFPEGTHWKKSEKFPAEILLPQNHRNYRQPSVSGRCC